MKCKKCGASLLETDKFCVQCGSKVEMKKSCPECGAALREGTKFCPKCGRMIADGEDFDEAKVFVKESETEEIPIADIEQNILSVTEREMRISDKDRQEAGSAGKAQRKEKAASKSDDGMRRPPKPVRTAGTDERRRAGDFRDSEYEERRSGKAVPAPELRRAERSAPVRKRAYEEWEEDWDEDDEEDDESNIMTIVSVCAAFLIIAVAAFLIFTLVRKQPTTDYGENTQQTDDEEAGNGTDDGEAQQENDVSADGTPDTEIQGDGSEPSTAGTLTIVSNVNVRDNPTTQGSSVIKVAKEGETYEYTGTAEDDNWYIIKLEDGSTGYIFKKYVSVD